LTKIAGSSGKRRITARILDDIGAQVSRYMLIQAVTSLFVGVASGVAFWWIGLEQATIWGIVVGLLDMIPYFGPVVATAGLFTIGFLQFGTVTMGLTLAGISALFMSLEGFVLTPWLTMRTMRINGVALFLGLMFWGWMWGFWGILLAVPMMVMIKSISDHIEDLKPIGELLGT
jgi:predicted PurR-regulated permease PerM